MNRSKPYTSQAGFCRMVEWLMPAFNGLATLQVVNDQLRFAYHRDKIKKIEQGQITSIERSFKHLLPYKMEVYQATGHGLEWKIWTFVKVPDDKLVKKPKRRKVFGGIEHDVRKADREFKRRQIYQEKTAKKISKEDRDVPYHPSKTRTPNRKRERTGNHQSVKNDRPDNDQNYKGDRDCEDDQMVPPIILKRKVSVDPLDSTDDGVSAPLAPSVIQTSLPIIPEEFPLYPLSPSGSVSDFDILFDLPF